MYYPYLAIFWNSGNPAQQAAAGRLLDRIRRSKVGWTLRVSSPGGAVFDSRGASHPMTVYALPEGHGAVFGRLFPRDTSAALASGSIPGAGGSRTLAPRAIGEHLIHHYWGAYVAFAIEPEAATWMAMRDPSGMIPCYSIAIDGITLFFADIRHILELHECPQINWRYVIAFLLWPHLQIRETALTGVHELLAGEIMTGSGENRTTGFAWDPISVCRSNPILDEESSRSELLQATQHSIEAWSSLHGALLHSLSGGFDSAVVLGAIRQARRPPDVVCVNRYGDAPGEDERRFARNASERHGVQLLEIPWSASITALDESLLGTPDVSPKPAVPHVLGTLDAPFWNGLCDRYRCDGITTGQGGDHLFMSARTALGVADCFRLHGWGFRFRESLWNAAFLTGQSYLHILTSAAGASLSTTRFLRHAICIPTAGLVTPDAIFPELSQYILPPWYAAAHRLSPGKRFQVLQLSEVLNRHRPMPGLRVTDELHPLLSQPLLEVALRIPLHLLQVGGKTRGLARTTFKHLVPASILARELKGHTSAYILGLINSSLPFVRQLLVDGILVSRGILSPMILTQQLDAAEPLRAQAIFPLLAAIAAELWVRSLETQRCRTSQFDDYRLAAATNPIEST